MGDPLHGITLKALLQELIDRHGWEELARLAPVRCFQHEPSLNSSLKFLRKTPWARAKVEGIYRKDHEEAARKRVRNQRRAARREFSATAPVERPETLGFYWPAGLEAPEVPLDPGFVLAPLEDRGAFEAIQRAIGFEVGETTWAELAMVPGSMVVVHQADEPVAMACAQRLDGDWVELAWVAVAPSHRGKGLGRAVSAAVVGLLLEAGHTRIFGSTQDERVQALRIYLDLGFEPVHRPEKAERWSAVLDRA